MTTPTRLLRVQTSYFTAGAVWSKIYGVWSCTHAAPILHWMRGLSPGDAKLALLRMNATFDFLPLMDRKNGLVRAGQGHSGPGRPNASCEPCSRATAQDTGISIPAPRPNAASTQTVSQS